LLKRRKRTSSKLDVMLTHLAIADLMVSWTNQLRSFVT
jgi:hypothetical protein